MEDTCRTSFLEQQYTRSGGGEQDSSEDQERLLRTEVVEQVFSQEGPCHTEQVTGAKNDSICESAM